MTRKEFMSFDIRALSDKAARVWAASDQGLYNYVKDCSTADEINAVLEELADPCEEVN